MAFVYLLHFDSRYPNGKRPQHYVGVARDLDERMAEHRRGSRKSRLMAALKAARIEFTLTRSWEFENPKDAFDEERKIKRRRHHARLCPICTGSSAIQNLVQSMEVPS